MLRRLSLRNFVIVESLEVEFDAGFTVLTGETGAGKSILIDALQLALGSRGDANVVREGAQRTDIGAEFDAPPSLSGWLEEGGFEAGELLLLRRTIDAQGKSRAWINGSAATIAQLREAADHLVDIHGQHAWQSLTRSDAVRALLDSHAGVDTAPLSAAWSHWRQCAQALAASTQKQAEIAVQRDRLIWQIAELEQLAPGPGEWADLESEHRRLSNAQSLIEAARQALDALSEADDNVQSMLGRATHALTAVVAFDSRLNETIEVLASAQSQVQDATHTLSSYLHQADLEPQRLQALDDRLSSWIGLARRHRRSPQDLPGVWADWKKELRELDAAADLDAQQREADLALTRLREQAGAVSVSRRAAAPRLSAMITQTMQKLGMSGGRFEVGLTAHPQPQAFGLESVEFLVAGHAGSTPRPLAKVASGGELSRIALAIAVTTSQRGPGSGAGSALIFDEIDAGVGGAVAETVGKLMKQLGRDRQVLAVTHLPQVAACADHHFVVSKRPSGQHTFSDVQAVEREERVAEIARMLGGERLSPTSLAHAQEMLTVGADLATPARGRKRP